MFRRWLSAHKSLVASATSGSVVAALVITIAVVSTGYTAQRLDLGDASVWVVNGEQQAIGRANTEVLELNTVVASTGTDIESVQQGSTVLLFDRSNSKADIIDPATSLVEESVPLPPNRSQVYVAGDHVVVHEQGTGELWIVPVMDFANFDAESASTLSLGADAVVSVAGNGAVFAFLPDTRQVLTIDIDTSAVISTETVDFGGQGAWTISSVSAQWVVYDALASTMYFADRTVGLADLVGDAAAVLEQPSVAGQRVLVAHSAGLISVPLDGGEPIALVDDGVGAPSRPIEVAGCEFVAWSTGQAWRECANADAPSRFALESMPGAPLLSFVANGDRVVLNDSRSGASWAVQRNGELIDNWDDLILEDEDEQEQEENDEDVPPEVDKVQQPPVAIDDAFGARPGRATVLPVLINDYDPNGDVLVIGSATSIPEDIGRLDLINERQQIQLTLAADVVSPVSFSYTITDGRGGTATATVSITVRAPGENSPPQQVRSTKTTAQVGGRVTSQVLADWVDPDGDAFYLTTAVVPSPDTVSHKPEGTVVYSDSGSGSNLKIVALVVSDGTAEGSGSLSVAVRPPGEVPIIAEPFALLAYAGQELTIAPLEHVRGGTGTVRLNSVPSKAGVTINPSYEAGTFRFTSEQVRTHYLEYVVTDGDQTVTGTVRVDVASPPDANTKPITIPKTVFVKTLSNTRVDVAGTDIDPAGGVLLVTGIANLPDDSGVRAEVLEQRIIRVSLDQPLDNGPVSFNYRISNGLAEAEGIVTVIEIPTPSTLQPPIATDDTITARVGQAIDIPVLVNDEHPDGEELTLVPELAQDVPDGSGLLFASGSQLRYLAPDKTGNFTAIYQVEGPDGQRGSAQVKIAVREADESTNNSPVPVTVTARVLAGESVNITIPLSGIDPDGDSVQLLGQATSPEKGFVESADTVSFLYHAGDYSAGTDTFTYTVIDALGARATGIVRIGISPRLDGARNPVAIIDEVTVRPGVTVTVDALANDSDPDGSPLTVVGAQPNDPVTEAAIVGNLVQVTPPEVPGTYGVVYSIENDFGGTSQNFIRVTVDPNAPRAYPVAGDSVLTLSDVLDRDRVNVDVLANVFFADGSPRDLGLSVYPGYGDVAQVTSNKRIQVTIENESQIIPFVVSHPDDESIRSYAFIIVPGLDDALPQIDRRAPRLEVASEDTLVIDINDYVIAVAGKPVTITDSSTVRATHANGDDLLVDGNTLEFTSADKYFGPASISFEVTDGASAGDPNGRKAILVLPIEVTPRENQPPSFDGAVLEFEPGEEKQLDLLRLTTYPYPDDLDELAYSLITPAPVGFDVVLNGSFLTLRADVDAIKGSTTAATLGVRDSVSEGRTGRIELTIVPSTRPLLQPAPDTAIAPRGTTTTIDVLTNDEATNPFPGEPLSVVAIRGLDGGGIPTGVTINPSADNETLSVAVSADAAPGDINLQYQAVDASLDRDRYVWGSVKVSVQDRPDPVSNVFPSGFADGIITMRWNPGSFNNSPITNYRVSTFTMADVLISTIDCPATTCDIPTPGNGPQNSVRVSVVAQNAIGDSDATRLDSGVWSDIIPPAPAVVSSAPLDHQVRLTWTDVVTPPGGSAVDRFHVVVGGFSADVSPAACNGITCTWETPLDWGLPNGVPVSFTISPRNAAFTALSVWNTSEPQSETPAGPPISIGPPAANAESDTTVRLSWSGIFSDNGKIISNYMAAAYTGAAPTCSPDGTVQANGAKVISAGTGTSAVFTGLSANATYSLVVFAFNGQGCTASPAVVTHTPPGVVTALTRSGPLKNGDVYDFAITGGAIGGEALTAEYSLLYRLVGVDSSEYGPIGLGDFLSAGGQQYGHSVSVQVRACRTWDSGQICQSSYSASFPLGVPVDPRVGDYEFEDNGAGPLDNNGTFTWTNLPAGDYEDVLVACGDGDGDTFVSAFGLTSCTTEDVGLQDFPFLTVRVTANGGQNYDIVYPG